MSTGPDDPPRPLTLREISARLRAHAYYPDASPATVGRWLHELGVPRRRRRATVKG